MGWPEVEELSAEYPRTVVVDAVRQALAERRRVRDGVDGLSQDVEARLRSSLRRVINATGVLLSTNLGRAPLASRAIRASMGSAGYASLEWSVERGERGSRHDHLKEHLRVACGAPASAAFNTNAGAVLVTLCALAGADGDGQREAIVSRGQLVEIGGGFRVPDVLAASGCRLVEVGTTNRTRLSDYSAAVGPRTAAIVRVHRSNFSMTGFVDEPSLGELAGLAEASGTALIDDIGSGLLRPDPLLADEPDVSSGIRAGAIVCFSADKLLGGPQAGIVAGPAEEVERIADHPLARALRVDKLRLAALEATLALHRDPVEARYAVPTLRALHEDAEARERRARRLATLVAGAGDVVPTVGAVGGGAAPGVELSSWGVALGDDRPDRRAARLRTGAVPVATRIHRGRVVVDVLAVPDAEIDELAGLVEASA